MASSTYTIGGVEDRLVLERKLHVVEGPLVVLGKKSYEPTAILAIWSRDRHSEWTLISVAFEGEQVVRDEDGRPERRPELKITHRFEKLPWVPTWMTGAAKSYKPSKDGELKSRS
jgi:hypothetical protein